MLYNKNRFKKVNDKKILHKIKKHWVTISVALLGLIGVKSVAMHTNVSADTTANADDPQANHQLSNQSIKSTASLVPNKGAGVTSTHSASSSQASSNPSANVGSSSVAQHNTYNSFSASYSVASTNGSGSVKSHGIPSEAQQIHNQILNEFADNNQASQTKARHLLGGAKSELQVNNSSIMGQLMNIMHNNIQNGTNETGAKQAYSDLMNVISPDNLAHVSDNAIDGPTWYSYLTRFQNDLTTINNNGNHNSVIDSILDKLNNLENQPVNAPLIGPVTLKNNASELLNFVPSYSLNDLGTRFDTPGGFAHKILAKVIPDESKLDQIGAVMHALNNTVSNSKLKQDYSNVVNDLTKLPSQNRAQQASTLSDLSNHISTFASDVSTQGNSYLPNQDKQYFSGITSNLDQAHQAVSKESTKLNGQLTNNINSELNQYNAGSLFNDVINYVIANNDYAKLDSVANDAKTDFANATNASGFISSFVGQIVNLKNADVSSIKTDLQGVEHNQAVSNAYNVAKVNSDATNSVLNNLAGLDSVNATGNLDNVHNAISDDASLAAINALNNVAASASAEATSVSNDNAYKGLLNNEATLFSGVVNRINASGFNSNAFNTLVGNVKHDLANAANVSDFANDLNGQVGAFDGVTAQKIKGYLNNLKNNPEFSNAYQAVRTSSAAADSILDDLSGMNSNDEVAKLSDIANVTGTNFSNSANFGSFANDTSVAVNNVAASQANSAYQNAQNYADLAGQASTSAQTSAQDAQQYVSGLPSGENSIEAKNEAGKANDDANDAVQDAKDALAAADRAHSDSLAVSNEHPVAAVHGFGAMAPETKEAYVQDAVENANRANEDNTRAQQALGNVKNDLSTARQDADQAQNTPDVSIIAGLIQPVFNAITKPGFKASQFDGAIQAVESHLGDTSLSQLWNDVKGNPNVAAFTSRHGNTTNQVISDVTSNDKGLQNAYQKVHNDGSLKTILNKLVTIAKNHDDANGKSANQTNHRNIKDAVNTIVSTIDNDPKLKAIDGMTGNDGITGKVNSVSLPSVEQSHPQTTTANVQPIADMMPTILDAITKPGFKASQFDGAIQAVESHLGDSSLSQLWNDVKGDSNVAAFTSRHGNLTQQITNLLNSSDSEIKGLSQAYQQAHNDGNVSTILNDLQKIANNHLDNNGKSASHQTNVNVQNALKSIANAINGDKNLKNIQGMQNVARNASNESSYNQAIETPAKPQTNKASVQLIANMMPTILNAITKPNFDSHDFNSAIDDVNSHLNIGNLTDLWNAIKDDSSVKAFTNHYGIVTNQVVNLLNNSNNGDFKAINQAYQQAHNDSNVKNILSDLQKIANNHKNADGKSANHQTNVNVQGALNDIASIINGDNILKDIQGMQDVAQNASNESSYNPAIETPAKPQTTKASVQPIADMMPTILNAITKPNFKASQFDGAIQAVESHLGDSSLSQLWNDVKGNANVTDFTSRHGNLTNEITNLLNGNSSEIKELNQAYQQAHNDNNVKNILSDLQKIANNHKDSDGKSATTQTNTYVQNALKSIASVINGDKNLKNIQGMQDIAQNASNESSYNPAIEKSNPSTVTPSVQVLDDMLQPILNRIVAKGFNSSAFQSAINAVKAHIKDANTLSNLWAKIQNNNGVQYFVGNHGKLTQNIISKLSETNSPLEAAYEAGHQDPAMTRILNDLSDVSKHQQISNGKVAKQSDIDTVNRDLNDINYQINHSNLKQIAGAQTLMSHVHYNATAKKPATPTKSVTPDVSSVVPLISRILNRMTAADFDSRNFDNVIGAVKSNISSAPSLSKLWSDIDNDASVKHFVGPVANAITSILNNGDSQMMKGLNAAYQKAHHDSQINNVLTDLQQIADNHLDSHNLAQQNSKRAKIVDALNDLNTQITGVNNSDKITGLSEIASDAKEAEGNYRPQNVEPSIKSINDLVPFVLSRITSNDFDKGAFRSAIVAIEHNMNQADSLSKLWSTVKNDSGIKHFVGNHGELTDRIVNDLINADPQLEAAYEVGHQSHSVKDILNQLSNITNASLDANDKSANVEHALTQIANDLNDSSLSSINKGNLSNEVNSLSSNYAPVSLPFITKDFVNDVLGRLTDPQFNKGDFKSAITDPNNGIEHALATQNSLDGFWNAIQRNSSVKAFINAKHLGKLTGQIETVLKNNSQYNAAYQVAHDDSANVDHILSDLNDIAQQKLDPDGKNNQVDNDLADVAKVIQQDPKLQAVGGLPTVENTAQADDHNYQEASHQVVPHYGDDSFNEALGHLINHYTVKDVVDHLASIGDSADSDENKAVHAIIGDLSNLPSLSDQTDINRKLGDVYSELNHFHGPVSHFVAGKLQSLLSNIEDHDKTPDGLAAYADQIGGPDGALINDFDKTMQDVKNDLNNADYRKVLNEFNDLNTKNEDRNLKAVAAAINAHGLKGNPLLKDLALNVRHVANAESSERKNNNKQRRSDEVAQKIALKKQHDADSKRHNALAKDLQRHKQDVARHNQIIQDHNQQQQDSIRHNELIAARHQHNRHDAARANYYAKNASTEAQAAQKSAASAQQYAHGLNSSGNVNHGNSAVASMVVLEVDSYEQEAESDATQALDDVKFIEADYDNVSFADANVTNASSAASDASDAVDKMNNDMSLAAKYARSDGYVAPSSSTSNGSGKSSGESGSSSSAPSSAGSSKASGKSSASSNGTKPSSQSSVTSSSSNGKKTSSSASSSNSSQPSSKSAHASSGSSSQTSGKSTSGSAKSGRSNSSKSASSKASSGSASQSTASNGKSNSSSQASKSASQSGKSAPSSKQSNSNQPSSGSSSSASNSNSASQSNGSASSNATPSNNSNSSTNSNSSSASNTSNGNSSASMGSSAINPSSNGDSYNPSQFTPDDQSSNPSYIPLVPNTQFNVPQSNGSLNSNSTNNSGVSSSSNSSSVASNSTSGSIYSHSDKINTDDSIVNSYVASAMADLNNPVIKRDSKITSAVNKDRQILRLLGARIAKDKANPTSSTLKDANACAFRAGLVANDANKLLNEAEYYGLSQTHHSRSTSSSKTNPSRHSYSALGLHSKDQKVDSGTNYDDYKGVTSNGNGVSIDNRSESSKLPQTGESQNTVAMIAMAWLSLSVALISALGYGLDKKRRHE